MGLGMNRPVIIGQEAEEDLADAKRWYQRQRAGLEEEFRVCVEEALTFLEQAPEAHPVLYKGVRKTLIRRFPYAIFYQVEEDHVAVLAVLHKRRHPRTWQSRAARPDGASVFTFRYIGHFDLENPFIKVDAYSSAVHNVVLPVPQTVLENLLGRFPADRASLKWYYGAIMSFLSRAGEFHPPERAMIEEAKCSALNMRLEIISRGGVVTEPLVDELWSEDDYLSGPRYFEFHWCEVFQRRFSRPRAPMKLRLAHCKGSCYTRPESCSMKWAAVGSSGMTQLMYSGRMRSLPWRASAMARSARMHVRSAAAR
jgi:toxin ParE1/3/4